MRVLSAVFLIRKQIVLLSRFFLMIRFNRLGRLGGVEVSKRELLHVGDNATRQEKHA